MAVFRVEKSRGYTVMSNHHLRNKELSLKAKGLLSQMLSLPEDWDYTLAGLSHINRESIDAIRTAVWELEKAGYITRRQGRDEKGKMAAIEYTIYEQPQPPSLENPILENPTTDKPVLENPTTENPTSDNPTQINKEEQRTDLPKKEKSNTDLSNTHSIPILSPNPSPLGDDAAEPQERKRKEAAAQSAFEIYEEIIKDNIEYDILKQNMPYDYDRLDEIVDLMLETVCTRRKTIRIAGDDYPAELVKAKFMKLDSEHMLTFIYKTGFENSVDGANFKPPRKNSKAAKQCADLCSDTTDEVNAMCSYHSNDTCGDGCAAAKSGPAESLGLRRLSRPAGLCPSAFGEAGQIGNTSERCEESLFDTRRADRLGSLPALSHIAPVRDARTARSAASTRLRIFCGSAVRLRTAFGLSAPLPSAPCQGGGNLL